MSKFKPIITIYLFLFVTLIGCENPDLSWYEFDNVKLSGNMNDSTNIQSNVSYEWEAILVDIPLPKVTDIKGRAKLLQHDKTDYAIGYKIDVIIDSLKSEDIPEKYTQTRSIETGLKDDIEVLPLKEVLYEAFFEFTLLDKDGFEIEKIKSSSHHISSGKINELKSKTDYLITPNKASLIGDIKLDITITKCVSCR